MLEEALVKTNNINKKTYTNRMSANQRIAQIQYTKSTAEPIVEVTVPFGTRIGDVAKIQDLISSHIISKISPRGCNACTSGVHLHIREQLENVIRVDLDAGKIIG